MKAPRLISRGRRVFQPSIPIKRSARGAFSLFPRDSLGMRQVNSVPKFTYRVPLHSSWASLICCSAVCVCCIVTQFLSGEIRCVFAPSQGTSVKLHNDSWCFSSCLLQQGKESPLYNNKQCFKSLHRLNRHSSCLRESSSPSLSLCPSRLRNGTHSSSSLLTRIVVTAKEKKKKNFHAWTRLNPVPKRDICNPTITWLRDRLESRRGRREKNSARGRGIWP